jgi:hypothetical protein
MPTPISFPPICKRHRWSQERNHRLVRQQPRSFQTRQQMVSPRPRGKVGRKRRLNRHATIAAADGKAKSQWAHLLLCQRTNLPTTVLMGETAPYLVLAGASLQVDPVGERQWDTKDVRGASEGKERSRLTPTSFTHRLLSRKRNMPLCLMVQTIILFWLRSGHTLLASHWQTGAQCYRCPCPQSTRAKRSTTFTAKRRRNDACSSCTRKVSHL